MIGSKDIRNQSVRAVDVAPDAIGRSELRDDSVGVANLSDWVQAQLGKNGERGPRGPRGPQGESGSAAEYAGPEWSIIDRNVIGAGDAYLRSGPSSAAFGPLSTPPEGEGSLGIRTASGADKATFGNQVDFAGDSVLDLDSLSYWVFTTNENNAKAANNMPSITFEIDPNLASSDSDYSSMVFAPDNSAAGWTQINAATDEAGRVWGLTGKAGGASGCDLNGTRCTWSELMTALDDDGEVPTIYTVAISKGRDFAFSGAVDALEINGEVFDFEPFGVE